MVIEEREKKARSAEIKKRIIKKTIKRKATSLKTPQRQYKTRMQNKKKLYSTIHQPQDFLPP